RRRSSTRRRTRWTACWAGSDSFSPLAPGGRGAGGEGVSIPREGLPPSPQPLAPWGRGARDVPSQGGSRSMSDASGYILGQSARAARRLEVQDAHFAEVSERLLDDLALRPNDRVVELGCGPGGFSRRVLRRLGEGGVLVGVDSSEGLLAQAAAALAGAGPARFETVRADITELGDWLAGADVVVARTMLHHVPMAELTLGRLRAVLRPGTRVGFIEPDF